MKNEAYGAFAYAYDQSLGNRFFRSVSKLLTRFLSRYPVSQRTHLDLACGSGLALDFFVNLGFESTGVDASIPMLEVAKARSSRVIAGDIRALPMVHTFGVVTCLFDSLNHLQSEADLEAAFREARACMTEGSLFLFDVNDPEIYPVVWGVKEPFVANGPDFHLELATSYDRASRLARALVTGWAMAGNTRVPIEEEHRQRAYEPRQIVAALGSAGLAPLERVSFDPYGESRRVKLFYACRASGT